jgi:toxin ParE1/3/4
VKVVITAAAKRDLIGIADYIRPHNPGRAASFVEELLDHCQTLAELPLRHPLVPRRMLEESDIPPGGFYSTWWRHGRP